MSIKRSSKLSQFILGLMISSLLLSPGPLLAQEAAPEAEESEQTENTESTAGSGSDPAAEETPDVSTDDSSDDTFELPENAPDQVVQTDPTDSDQPEDIPALDPQASFNSPFSQQNFVPDISLILDTSVGGRSLDNASYGALLNPFSLGGGIELHHTLNASNGFNLNYGELTLSSTVDPFFDLFATFHLSGFEFEVEEAYFRTRALPWNLQFKAGKFLSHFGRLNPQHAHFWSFSETSLVHETFFGPHGLNELGMRISWLAPTDFFLDLGLELMQGTNSFSFGTAGFTSGSQSLQEVNTPNLVVATVKSSADLLDNLVLLGGLSYAQGGTRLGGTPTGDVHVHQVSAPAGLEMFAGGSRIFGADLSLRWFIDSYRELSWQTEFLWRQLSGSRYEANERIAYDIDQSGLYSQLIWRFAQQWRSGLRMDLMAHQSRREAGQNLSVPAWLPRWSAMVEFTPSEFSRFRLQYSLDQSRFSDTGQQNVHGLYLQANLAMGAHGAHDF